MYEDAQRSAYSLGAHEGGASAGSLAPVSAAPPRTVVRLHDVPRVSTAARTTLWVDAVAGALAGSVLLLAREPIATWFGFPLALVLFNAAANLGYASYSGTLAALTALEVAPPRRAVRLLVAVNAAWVAVCLVILWQVWERATLLGLGYVALEALFVGTLAYAEYRAFLTNWPR